ncbi:MAG: hypothetical protein RLZ67_399 [Actinomycetota bacterium]
MFIPEIGRKTSSSELCSLSRGAKIRSCLCQMMNSESFAKLKINSVLTRSSPRRCRRLVCTDTPRDACGGRWLEWWCVWWVLFSLCRFITWSHSSHSLECWGAHSTLNDNCDSSDAPACKTLRRKCRSRACGFRAINHGAVRDFINH